MENKPSDYQVRERATNPLQSFVVNAPAGSGKTTLLVTRILKLLTIIEKPSEIIAITFTKKAAAQMRRKLIDVMGKNENKINDQVRALALKAKENAINRGWEANFIESMDIITIDSLASKIIRKAPILSSSFFANITEDPSEQYEEAAKRTILEMNENDMELITFLNYDTKKIKSYLIELLKKRDQWIDVVKDYKASSCKEIEKKTYDYYQNEVKEYVDSFSEAFSIDEIKDIENILIYIHNASPKIQFLYKPDDINFWIAFGKLVLTNDGAGSIRKSFDKRMGFSADEESEIHKAKLKKIIENKTNEINNLSSIYNVISAKKIGDIFPSLITVAADLLSNLDAHLSKIFLIAKTMDFTQALRYATLTLQQTSVAEIMDNQISHILVDEYQDTNEAQVKFIKSLTDNFSGNPKKSFFVVGDPMQSIYRFRKSEVRLFKEMQTNGVGDLRPISLELTVNFRSSKKICHWLNTEYRKTFGLKDDVDKGLIKYNPCKSDPKNDAIGTGIHFHMLKGFRKASANKANEATYVYDLIVNICKNSKLSQIAVLARNRSHLREILSIFHRKQIPNGFKLVTTEIDNLQDKQSFQDILSLTKALYDLSDKISWIATLRAPWCGLTLKDLCVLFEDCSDMTSWEIINRQESLSNLSADALVRLNFFKKVVERNIQNRGRIAHRFFIESIWRQLNGEELLLDPNDIVYIDTFLDNIDKASTPLSIDFKLLERLIENIHTSSQSNDKASKEILFMTIHKAKGMEFESVIITGLGQPLKNDGQSLIAIDKDILSINNFKVDDSNLYDYQQSKETLRLKNERVRLLYVGISRSIEDCHLIGTVKPNKDGEYNARSDSLLKILEPIIKDCNQWKFIDSKRVEDEKSVSYESYQPKLRRIKTDSLKANEITDTHIFGKILGKELKPDHDNIYTYTGTIIHQYFKLIIKKQLDINYILSNKLDYIQALFIKKDYKKEEITMALDVIKKSLLSLCNTEDGQWIYAVHEDDQIELQHLIRLGGTLEVRVPDRSFINDNTRWIIDYKILFSDKDLITEVKKHTGQMSVYESLYDNKYPIKKAIYFAPKGKLITL